MFGQCRGEFDCHIDGGAGRGRAQPTYAVNAIDTEGYDDMTVDRVDLARAEEAHAESVERRAGGIGHAREESCERAVEHVDEVTSCAAASVAAVSVPISPAPTTTTRLCGTARCRASETRPAPVVFSSACSSPGTGGFG